MLLDAFESNWIAPLGPHVDAFERGLAARCGRRAAAAVSSGTAALQLGLRLVGVKPGDEVLVPTLTFVATANAAVYLGARPVFLDVSEETWTIAPDALAEELERRSRSGSLPVAVVSVDLYGQCADYGALEPLCAHYGVALVEDAAEALGADAFGRPAGAFGACAAVSFNGNKIITTSGGGALLADDEELVGRARWLASQAREPVAHYEHTEIGYNLRLSNLLAALGIAQLAGLDDRVARRREIRRRYADALSSSPGVEMMPEAPYGRSTGWLSCILVDPAEAGVDREALRLALEQEDIESRPTWKPLHLQPVYADAPRTGCRVAESIFERGLCLPSGSNLAPADQDRVIGILGALLGQ